MMFRTNMPENAGMLFLLGYPQQASFWMTNCPLPLSVATLIRKAKSGDFTICAPMTPILWWPSRTFFLPWKSIKAGLPAITSSPNRHPNRKGSLRETFSTRNQ